MEEYVDHLIEQSIIEELEEQAENWEKTAETYKFRLDKALRDNADLAAEKQRLLALIDSAPCHPLCFGMANLGEECDCFKSKARDE
jgi:hypothetical protein